MGEFFGIQRTSTNSAEKDSLLQAIQNNDLETVQQLFNHGADPKWVKKLLKSVTDPIFQMNKRKTA